MHITASGVANFLDIGGSFVGGAVGNGMEAAGNGIETYENIENHQYGQAVFHGAETIYHGAEAVVEGMAGDWIF
jgi:hypothetical protein